MSYKLNMKDPERKNAMRLRRIAQRSRKATPPRPRRKIGRDGLIKYLAPKQGNKYILTGRRKDGTRLARKRMEITKAERERTPPLFAEWLLDAARRCSKNAS